MNYIKLGEPMSIYGNRFNIGSIIPISNEILLLWKSEKIKFESSSEDEFKKQDKNFISIFKEMFVK